MKHFCLPGKMLLAVISLFLISCGSNETKTETTDDVGSDTTASVSDVTPMSTISTVPQNMLVAKHKVADFGKWLQSYEAHDSLRLANGLHSYVIGRGVEDSNMVLVAIKVDDLAKAKEFGKSNHLKEAMKKGGVTGVPQVRFATTAFQDTGNISSDIRSMSSFTVKDWDAWKSSFDSGRQMRMDNGVSDRVYSHDADDNKKVIVVVAVNDSAKANAFWKSDLLKQRRAASGVIGQPERFNYRIVKRY
ncbi:MAG: hypothetical protein V4717_06230 [Bacteroidota bacterium]